MDKAEFVNLAPEYYMLAFCIYCEYPQSYYSEEGWINAFTVEEDGYHTLLIPNEGLRAEAIRLLIKRGAISVLSDPFGPTLWIQGERFAEVERTLTSSPDSPFFKADKSGHRKLWLMRALVPLNKAADEFQITAADFGAEPIDEWKPITISQADPTVTQAVQKLEAATEAIESDNGYSVAHPQERDQVVHDLKGSLERLKSDAVSLGWVRRTLSALKTASGRFANTVKGQTIDGAMLAIKEFVKKHMSEAIEHLWSLLP